MDEKLTAEEIENLRKFMHKELTKDESGKIKKGIVKGFKMAAIPFKLLNAMIHPRRTFLAAKAPLGNLKDSFVQFARENFVPENEIKSKEELDKINSEIEAELEKEAALKGNLLNEEPEAVVNNEVAPEATEVVTPTEIQPEVIAPMPIPELTAEPTTTFNSNTITELNPTEFFNQLLNRQKELRENIETYKSSKDMGISDEHIQCVDELEMVTKQIKQIEEQREEELKRQEEIENNKLNEEPVVAQEEEFHQMTFDDYKPAIFDSMKNFLTEIIKDKESDNTDIDRQMEMLKIQMDMLSSKKSKNDIIISEYKSYIDNSFTNTAPQVTAELPYSEMNKDEKEFEKAHILTQINEIKVQMRDLDFDSSNKLRDDLAKLEGRLEDLNTIDKIKTK